MATSMDNHTLSLMYDASDLGEHIQSQAYISVFQATFNGFETQCFETTVKFMIGLLIIRGLYCKMRTFQGTNQNSPFHCGAVCHVININICKTLQFAMINNYCL